MHPLHVSPVSTKKQSLDDELGDKNCYEGLAPEKDSLPENVPEKSTVQATVEPVDIGSNTSGDSDPRRWLSSNPVTRFFCELIPYGGIISNCFSLGSVTLGGGIISMPSTFRDSGLIMGVIYLVVINVLTIYTLAIMAIAMEKSGYRTYEEMARGLFGRGWDYFVGFVLWLSCVGTAIAYISGASSLVNPLLQRAPNTPDFLKTVNGNRVITSLIWLVLMVPIVIPKRVNSIRYVSAVGCTMVVYFVISIVVHSSGNGLKKGMRGDMKLFTTGNQAIYGLSIFVFSFMCQAVTYSVYFEMRPRRSVKQLTIASAIAMTTCTILYIMAGIFGYFDFANETENSILYNYDPIHTPYMMVSYIGMLIKICAAYAMNMIPIRNFMYHCLRWNLDTVPYWKHTIAIVSTSAVVLVCGLFIPNVNTAFGFVGSLCGGFIGFIFPALFWMYSGDWSLKSVGIWNWLVTYFLLVCGVIAIVFGSVATIHMTFAT